MKKIKKKATKKGKGFKITAITLALLMTAAAGGAIAYAVRGTLPEEAPNAAFIEGLAADNAGRRKDDDTRIMSANLLVHYRSWGGSDAAPRAKQFIELLNKYQPDAAGLQEVSGQWFCLLDRNLPEGYRFVHRAATGLFARFTTIIYNENTLNLLESGSLRYDEGTDGRMRRIEWALFSRRDSGARFVLTTTHLDLLHEGQIEEELPILRAEAEQLLAFSGETKEKYGCPVILTGDFNAMEDTPYTKETDAKEIYALLAEKLTDTKDAALYAKSGLAQSLSEPCYDHIFLDGEASVTSFRLLSDPFMEEMSDHFPIYADFVLPVPPVGEGATE